MAGMRLADTSIRLYRKRDGLVSVRLHSYLMIPCESGKGFRLSAYLNGLQGSVKLESGQRINFDELSYTDDCLYRMDHMIHEFWASGSAEIPTIKDGAALLRIEYRLFSFETQGELSFIETIVPILARGPRTER